MLAFRQEYLEKLYSRKKAYKSGPSNLHLQKLSDKRTKAHEKKTEGNHDKGS